jgi:hypothetical protein
MPATPRKPRHAVSTKTPLKQLPEAIGLPGGGYERRFPIHENSRVDSGVDSGDPFAEWSSESEWAENEVVEDEVDSDVGEKTKGGETDHEKVNLY